MSILPALLLLLASAAATAARTGAAAPLAPSQYGRAHISKCVPVLLGAQRQTQTFAFEKGRITQPENGGLCLTATDSFEVQPAPGGPRGRAWGIDMQPCEKPSAATNQTWELNGSGGIVLTALGLCIDIAGYATRSGSPAHLWPCTAVPEGGRACPPTTPCPTTTGCTCTANQQFDWKADGSVIGLMSGLCLDAGETGPPAKVCDHAPANSSRFCDKSLPPAARAAALVTEANLTEQAANLAVTTPGYPRLGVGPPTFGEALHGVCTTCSPPSGPNSTGAHEKTLSTLSLSFTFSPPYFLLVNRDRPWAATR